MKNKTIDKEHIEAIRNKFSLIESKDDLLSLLNYAKVLLYGESCRPFTLNSLNYYANPEYCNNRYKQFSVKKKSGGQRIIHAPVTGLKSLLRALNLVIQCISEPHEAATGFIPNRSIVDNAKKHLNQNYVFNIDLSDFFFSFDRNRVKLAFMKSPFNLSGNKEPIAFLIAALCTHPLGFDDGVKIVLPQGSPTSPTLTNILCVKLDRRLSGLADRFGVRYTRYADDITFSSKHSIFNENEFKSELHRIISEDNLLKLKDKELIIGPQLRINEKKTRLQKSAYRQEVTGLIVNKKVNVRKRYVKQLRMWLYYWEKYGYEKAQQIFSSDYIADKGHVKAGKPNLSNVLDGKLEFLKMVKGVEDRTYKRLKDRFNKLIGLIEKRNQSIIDLNSVLSTLVNQGLDKAMKLYARLKTQ